VLSEDITCPNGHTNAQGTTKCGVCGLPLSAEPGPQQAAVVTTPSEHAMRWQYAIVNIGSFGAVGRLTGTLGKLGAEGWELVHVYDKASNWFQGMEKASFSSSGWCYRARSPKVASGPCNSTRPEAPAGASRAQKEAACLAGAGEPRASRALSGGTASSACRRHTQHFVRQILTGGSAVCFGLSNNGPDIDEQVVIMHNLITGYEDEGATDEDLTALDSFVFLSLNEHCPEQALPWTQARERAGLGD